MNYGSTDLEYSSGKGAWEASVVWGGFSSCLHAKVCVYISVIRIYSWETCLETSSEFREAGISNRWESPSPAPLLLYRWGIGVVGPRVPAPGTQQECTSLWRRVRACCPLVRAEPCQGCVQKQPGGGGLSSPDPFLTVFSPQGVLSLGVLRALSFAVRSLLVLISELDWKLLEDGSHLLSICSQTLGVVNNWLLWPGMNSLPLTTCF